VAVAQERVVPDRPVPPGRRAGRRTRRIRPGPLQVAHGSAASADKAASTDKAAITIADAVASVVHSSPNPNAAPTWA
jgi:hypothetical protein